MLLRHLLLRHSAWALTLIASAILSTQAWSAPAKRIEFLDTFSRTGPILGSTSDSGRTWSGLNTAAGTEVLNSQLEIDGTGSVFATIEGIQFRPHTRYELSMDVEIDSGGVFWLGMGFAKRGSTNSLSDTVGFLLRREIPEVQFFATSSTTPVTTPVPDVFPNKLEVVLEIGASLADSTLNYSVDGVQIAGPISVDASGVDRIFVSNNDSAALSGRVDNVQLCSTPIEAVLVEDSFSRSGIFIGSSADSGQTWGGVAPGAAPNGSALAVDGSMGMFATIDGIDFKRYSTYTLSSEVDLTSGGIFWLGMGFGMPGSGNALDETVGFILRRENPEVQLFVTDSGPVFNEAVPDSFPDTIEAVLTVGASLAESKISWNINGNSLGDPVDVDATGIDRIFLSNNASGALAGTFDNILLTELVTPLTIIEDGFDRVGDIAGSLADSGQTWGGSSTGPATDGIGLAVDGTGSMFVTIDGLSLEPWTNYSLSADIDLVDGGIFWLGLGFAGLTSGNPLDDTVGFYLRREIPETQFFVTDLDSPITTSVGDAFPDRLEVVLTVGTAPSDAYLEWYLNGVPTGIPKRVNAMDIDRIFLANSNDPSGNLMGSIDNLEVCVPEPGFLALLGSGLLFHACLARRRQGTRDRDGID